ncbi:eukaryotic rRNA processing [Apodospora peruviana]|uniref:Eukaryotic rRNA processing n=1 Tax=Apodospora peruviana TaxID=516989 RepID=A0AAE0IIR1_9PEZI|nr:eukaryotic rRNA processing [Apodospora peruviana]
MPADKKNGKPSKKSKNDAKYEFAGASDDDESDDEDYDIDLARIDDTDSDSEISQEEDEDDEDEEEEEEDIDLDDISIDEEDEENVAASARIRETINNKEALLTSLKRFALDTSSNVPFSYHQSHVSKKVTEETIPAVDDDIVRELAFMNQSLEAARAARVLLRKEGVPFTRPNDYFAETLRSDEIMEKVKGKLIEEATAKKASAEARKQRDLKKFGKQVQVAKLQERAKQKRETLEKITQLKKKRKDGASTGLGATEAEDLFDVAVENELKGGNSKKRSASFGGGDGGDRGGRGGPNKRQKKDSKFGFGGSKRHAKSGDAKSSGDLSGFNAKKMKSGGSGGPGGARAPKTRLGKSRRKAQAGKR